ncbi:MAG: sigma-70 family RNA polymerase sigma factor [Oscillospiraceae bacterium]|nr:sigma-70 family RNA polymerase sigma factor [Oscillospiraceae bacterium]
MTEDEKLLRLLLKHDESALAKAEQRYRRLCITMAFRILGDRQDAEECANDVLMKLWETVPPAEPRSLTAYVSGLTRNHALNMLTAKTASKRGGKQYAAALDELSPYLASDGNPEDMLSTIALQEALNRFLRALPKETRMIFLARYYAMQPIREIAAEHASTVGRVKMILKRTKEKLRAFLKEEGLI